MQISLILLALLSSVSLAEPISMPSRSTDEKGTVSCMAIDKQTAPIEGTNTFDFSTVKRNAALDHCGVSGYLKKRAADGPIQNHVTLDRCANFCVCTLGKENCKSFEWNEDLNKRGLGHCQIHTMSLNKHNHRSLPAKRDERPGPLWYNNDCFHEVRRAVAVMTSPFFPFPFPTTTPTLKHVARRTVVPKITLAPVPRERREAKPKIDNIVVGALLGV